VLPLSHGGKHQVEGPPSRCKTDFRHIGKILLGPTSSNCEA